MAKITAKNKNAEEKCRKRSKKSQLLSAALLDAMEAASAGARREKEPQGRSLEDARRLGFGPSRGGAVALHILGFHTWLHWKSSYT